MMDFVFWLHSLLLFAIAFLFQRFRPTKINALYGYRTPASMKNEKAWKIANEYSSKLIVYGSVVFLALQCVIWLIFGANEKTVIASAVLLSLVFLIALVLTEHYLKKQDPSV